MIENAIKIYDRECGVAKKLLLENAIKIGKVNLIMWHPAKSVFKAENFKYTI